MNAALEPDRYGTADVARLAGCTYRQIDYWCTLGLLHWDGYDETDPTTTTSGTGNPRFFTATEVRVASAICRSGVLPSTPLARAVADHVRTRGLTGSLKLPEMPWWRIDFWLMPDPLIPADA